MNKTTRPTILLTACIRAISVSTVIMFAVLALFVYLGMVNLFRTYLVVVTN